MHILHILDHSVPVQDGYSYRTLSILREQRALGWRTSQMTGGKQGPASGAVEEIDGYSFHRTAPPSGLRTRVPAYRQLAFIADLRRRLEQVTATERPDILHAHSPALDGVAALQVGRALGLPVVYEVRGFWEDAAVDLGTSSEGGPRYRATRAMETWVLKRADRVTTICEGMRADLEARGIPAERITVIPNGADPEEFQPRHTPDPSLARALGLEGVTVVGYIGSFYPYEGLHLAVEAMAELARDRDDVKALLVGGGLEEDRIRALVSQHGLGDRVILPGRVPRADVYRYYDLIDILVYPRLSMRLTELVTPLKPLEAMARGHLVLASDVGGHRELVRHGETGFLFPPGDAAKLAAAVSDLIARRDEWPRIEQAGLDFVRGERRWAHSVARYRDVYEPLLRGRAA